MNLGKFSLSLSVKDLAVSIDFYHKLGFTQIGGDADQGWVILDNNGTTIGLFQGMFPENIMTFNPGWGDGGAELDQFDDVRVIQQRLQDAGLQLNDTVAEDKPTGPAHITLTDPDGNQIMFDQHR